MKLTKIQQKRFDEWWDGETEIARGKIPKESNTLNKDMEVIYTDNVFTKKSVKQHLAKQLSRQKKETDAKWQKWWEDIVDELGKKI